MLVVALAPSASPALVPAARAPRARAAAEDWYFAGHGAGPGVGMGQWGALGDAVRYRWGYRRLLDHFYGGTAAGYLDALGFGVDPWISVLVAQNLDLSTNRGDDTVVTAATPVRIESGTAPPVAPLPASSRAARNWVAATAARSGSAVSVAAGSAVDLRLERNGTWDAFEGSSCPAAQSAARHGVPIAQDLRDPVVLPASRLPPDSARVADAAPPGAIGALSVCAHGGEQIDIPGAVEAFDRSGYERTVAVVPLESYVASVVAAEMPWSWSLVGGPGPSGEPLGFQALEAQAVAVRSFAVATALSGGWNGYASICDISICQVYDGSSGVTAVAAAAVAATAGQVRVPAAGHPTVVSTPYSASSGGYTAPGPFPAVPDRGDACFDPGDAAACNPFHDWRRVVQPAALSRALGGLGTLHRLIVDARDGDGSFGGRVLEVTVVGSAGTRTVTGNAFAAAAGLPSNWFVRVAARRPVSPTR
ncbi:MAG TPA: SpoIID/LytB domain-containing protein [Acidimicrobiales bacterium]|nr:SpoIID/LytB domain-containing protein [Acidimicrobiales bacterium]